MPENVIERGSPPVPIENPTTLTAFGLNITRDVTDTERMIVDNNTFALLTMGSAIVRALENR